MSFLYAGFYCIQRSDDSLTLHGKFGISVNRNLVPRLQIEFPRISTVKSIWALVPATKYAIHILANLA